MVELSIQNTNNYKHLLQVFDKGDFNLINTPDETTYNYRTGKGTSVIDLAFRSPEITLRIGNWAVNNGHPTRFDHKMIRFEIISESIELIPVPTAQQYNWKKAEWTNFHEYLRKETCGHQEEREKLIRNPNKTTWTKQQPR